MATKKATAPLAAHAAKPITSTMQTFAEWIESQTGYKVDPLSVQLSSALRGVWQAEQRAEKLAALDAVKVPTKPRTRKRGSTVATAEGVVIAEQHHVEAVSA